MPTICDLRNANPSVLQRVLDCNQADVAFTSPLDQSGLEQLIEMSMLAVAEPESGSFLLALGQDADYQSPNYLWFQQHLRGFAYIDRVVVARQCRGQGLARRFYAALEARARSHGLVQLTAEVNSQPDNPRSHAFHAAMGFTALHERDLSAYGQTGKRVLYYTKILDSK